MIIAGQLLKLSSLAVVHPLVSTRVRLMIIAVVGAVRSSTVDPHHRQGKFDFKRSNFMSATDDEAQFSKQY